MRKKLVKIGRVFLEVCSRIDRQTDRHGHHNTSPALPRRSKNGVRHFTLIKCLSAFTMPSCYRLNAMSLTQHHRELMSSAMGGIAMHASHTAVSQLFLRSNVGAQLVN